MDGGGGGGVRAKSPWASDLQGCLSLDHYAKVLLENDAFICDRGSLALTTKFQSNLPRKG